MIVMNGVEVKLPEDKLEHFLEMASEKTTKKEKGRKEHDDKEKTEGTKIEREKGSRRQEEKAGARRERKEGEA